jgi:hypothetical protein
LFTYNGESTSRIEVSFYGDKLKDVDTYTEIIGTLYPGRELKQNKDGTSIC